MMTASAPPSPVGVVARSPWRWLLLTAMAAGFVITCVSLPVPIGTGLDAGWQAALVAAHRQGLQFGPEVAFTYGPLGYLTTIFVGGDPPFSKMLWETLGKLALAVTLLALTSRLSPRRRGVLWMLFLASTVLFPESAMLLCIALIVVAWLLPRDARNWQMILGLGWLEFFSAMKFTFLLASSIGVAVVVAALFWRRQGRRALAVAGAFAFGFLAVWLMAGQALGSLPAYFKYSWELSTGYSWAMNANNISTAVWWLGAATWLLAAIFVVSVLRQTTDRTYTWPAVALLGAVWFLAWKHGFTRADGHEVGFFVAASMLAVAAPAFLLPAPRLAWLDLAPFLGALGIWFGESDLLPQLPDLIGVRFRSTPQQLVQRAAWRADYDAGERAARKTRAEPDLQATVGRATVDILSFDQSFIFANDLNYHPRPVIQSYAAFTPALLRHNLEFIQSDRAPAFVIARLETIDNRYAAQDDSLVLAELRRRYELVGPPSDFALLRRKSVQPAPINQPRQELSPRSLRLGEELLLPPARDFAVWLKVRVNPSLWGKIRAFAAQPPILEIVLTDDDGQFHRHRISSKSAAEGFIVQPLLEAQTDLNVFLGGYGLRWVKSVRFEAAPGTEGSWEEMQVQLSRLMDNPIESYDSMRAYVDQGYLNRLPESVSSDLAVERAKEGALSVLQVHAPGEIVVRRPADSKRLAGTFGIRTGAYGADSTSDGVEFSVEVRRDDGTSEVLWHRHLDPRKIPADRGAQNFAVDLPPGDYRLILRTGVGPTGNGDWDWSYWAGIRFLP